MFYLVMNLASLLLCLVFAAVGYIIHPKILKNLVEKNIVSEAALSDAYKKENSIGPVEAQDSLESESSDQSDTDTSPRFTDVPVGPKISPQVPEVIREIESSDTELDDLLTGPAPEDVVSRVTSPPAPVVSSEAEIVEGMKKSLRAKEVREFSYNDVFRWKSLGLKDIGGKQYHVGEVSYKKKTVFGEKKLTAEALFIEGKLIKWIWPVTNADMQ